MRLFHGADFLGLSIPQWRAVLQRIHPEEMGGDTHSASEPILGTQQSLPIYLP